MSYKSILVHVDASKHAPARISLAADLARSQEAHLIGTAMSGLTAEYYRNINMTFGGPLTDDQLARIRTDIEQTLDRFEAQVFNNGLSYERRYSDDDTAAGLVQQARYADLVVLSQTDPDDISFGLGLQLPEHLALHGGRPVLLVPYAGSYALPQRHALVAWDGGRSATRAVTDALPLLRRCARVTVVVFNAGSAYGAHGEQPGADIALYLTRHGLNVEVQQQQTPPELEVGDALLSLAADCGADLLVMGAYGHQRWREIVMGGATRRVLRTMTLPVLMAH